MADFQRNWAVVIGINDYQNQVPKLKTAKNDAEQLANILAQSHQYEVILITDDTGCKPTLERLLNLLEKQLPEKIVKEDRLLFYFAGHGIAKESDRGPAGFLVPQDADINNEGTLLPMQTLHDRLAALKCRHLLVILDCCFAGTFRWSITRLATVIPRQIHKEHYDRFINSPAWQAITSAAHNQEAYDINPINSNNRQTVPGTNHSPFAEALFKALQGEADIMPPAQKNQPAGDGVITATELSQYLQYRVAEIAGDRQTTQLWPLPKHNRGEYIFLHPDHRPPKLKSAPQLNKDNNPYRGLESFEEKHAQFFFGRKELIEKLLARISEPQQSLTVVLGVSGSGKSSLVKAGLIPCLKHLSKREVFEINFVGAGILAEAMACSLPQFFLKFLPLDCIHQWRILRPMRPGDSPFAALARIILPITETRISERLNSIDFLRELFQKRLEELNHKLNEFIDGEQESDEQLLLNQEREKFQKFATIWNSSNSRSKMLLLVEDFEELYELCKETENQDTQTKETKQQEELRLAFWDCLNPLSQRLQSEHKQFVNIVQKWSKNYPGIKLLLAIDQFEDLITLSRDEELDKKSNKQPEWQQFLKLLEEVIAANLEQLRIVVTLRSDFEPKFLNSDALKSHWAKARFPVRAMRSDELREAIERPAAEMALYFEPPNLVDRLIDEVGQMPGALPLLSFTLSEFYIKLYESWKPGNTDRALRIDADFEKEGGVAGSLTRRANQEYNELPDDAHRDTMRRVMLRMVTLEGGEPVRRRVSLSELVYANKQEPTQLDEKENQRVKVVLESLDKARLVVRGQETGQPYVEPAHDFLVKGWDKLQNWLENEQENMLLQRRLTLVAVEWKNQEHSTSLVGKAEPFLTRLDKKIDFAGEWLKQIKDREVQEIIEKAQIKLQQAIGELTSNQKVATFLIKTEKFLKLLDRKIDFSEKWLPKIRPQKTQESLPKKKVQFLWNGNPYLDVLKKTLKSGDYWFNQVEAEFVQQSIWQKRRNITFRWAITLTVIFIILFVVYVRFLLIDLTERATRAKNLLSSSYPLNGLLLAIQATGKSQSLWKPFLEPAWPSVQSSLRDAIETVREVNILNTPGEVKSIAFSADGQHIITTTTENEVNVWKIDGSPSSIDPNTIERDPNTINDSKKHYLADRQKIISISSGDEFAFEKIVKIENLRGDLIEKRRFYDTHLIAVRFDGKYAVTAGGKQGLSVKVWDLQGNAVNVFSGQKDAVNSVSVSPEDRTQEAVKSVAVSPDGQTIVSGSEDKTVRLWNLQGKSLILEHEDAVNSVAISPDGQTIVSGSEDKTVRLWGAKGKFIDELPHPGAVKKVAVSPDSQTIVSVTDENNATVYLWGISGKLIDKFSPNGGVESIAFYDDRTLVIAGNGDAGAVQLWDLNGKKTRVSFEKPLGKRSGYISSIAVSFDRQTIVTGGDYSVYLWNQQGKLVSQPFSNAQGTSAVAISKDSQYIVSGDGEGIVRLWDKQGNLIGEPLKTSEGSVTSVAISPNGEYIVSGNSDNTVRLWRAGNWQTWLRIGCARLRHHQSLNDSFYLKQMDDSEMNREARATCQKYVWK
jgi:WD40 repeat protein